MYKQRGTRRRLRCCREKCRPNNVTGDSFGAIAAQDLKITRGKWFPVLLSNNSARTRLKQVMPCTKSLATFLAALRFSSCADHSQLGHSWRGDNVAY